MEWKTKSEKTFLFAADKQRYEEELSFRKEDEEQLFYMFFARIMWRVACLNRWAGGAPRGQKRAQLGFSAAKAATVWMTSRSAWANHITLLLLSRHT